MFLWQKHQQYMFNVKCISFARPVYVYLKIYSGILTGVQLSWSTSGEKHYKSTSLYECKLHPRKKNTVKC